MSSVFEHLLSGNTAIQGNLKGWTSRPPIGRAKGNNNIPRLANFREQTGRTELMSKQQKQNLANLPHWHQWSTRRPETLACRFFCAYQGVVCWRDYESDIDRCSENISGASARVQAAIQVHPFFRGTPILRESVSERHCDLFIFDLDTCPDFWKVQPCK
jgi:hypothetical protein